MSKARYTTLLDAEEGRVERAGTERRSKKERRRGERSMVDRREKERMEG